MTAKDILFDAEARAKLKVGVDKLANAVKVTLGPAGRNVLIDKKFGAPTSTKDGVTACLSCNSRKHKRPVGDFLAETDGL